MTVIFIFYLALSAAHGFDEVSQPVSPMIIAFFRMLGFQQSRFDGRCAEAFGSWPDSSVDPCDDFYGFACNGWIKDHPIPPSSVSWNRFDALKKKLDIRLKEILSEGISEEDGHAVKSAKTIYDACMDEDAIEENGLEPLAEYIEHLGGWPLTTPDPNGGSSNIRWQDAAARVARQVGIAPVVDVNVNVDLRNTSRNVILVDQPPSSVPSYLFTDEEYHKKYESYLTQVARLLMENSPMKLYGYSWRFRREISRIMKFTKALTTLTARKEELKVLDKVHNEVSIKELQNWTDAAIPYKRSTPFRWKKYIRELLDKDETEVNDDTRVVVYDWEFMRGLFQLIENTKETTVVNFIMWEVVQLLTRSVNKKMRMLEFEFRSGVAGVTEDVPRWLECVQATDDVTFAIGYMYVKKHFGKEAKAKAVEIVDNIRKEFRLELSKVDWIDEETKRAALEKADAMNQFVGYPDWLENVTAVNDYYKGLTTGRNHFANVVAVRRFLTRKHLKKLDDVPDRSEWPLGPAVINAFYNIKSNSIIIPAGILEPPFFEKDRPETLNYASIGSIIGHEITHAFDDIGRQIDKSGNIHQWWSEDTEERYMTNAKCFIEEYGKFSFPDLNDGKEAKLNGIITLGENIADNGGLAVALAAYQKHSKTKTLQCALSQERLFYLGFATTWCETVSDGSLFSEVMEGIHSPHMVRVLGTLSNSEHFAKTWNCKLGSRMNPAKKCKLW